MRHFRPLFIALLALAVLGWQFPDASATHDGTGEHIDQMSIDMGPPGVNNGVEGNGKHTVGDRDGDGIVDAEGAPDTASGGPVGVCGNGLDDDPAPPPFASFDGVADDGCQVTLTPLETCAEIIDDGILNADEDLVVSGQDIVLVDVTVGQHPGTAPGTPGGVPASRRLLAWQYNLNWAPDLLSVRSPQQFNFLLHTDGAGGIFVDASASLPDLVSPFVASVLQDPFYDDGSGVLSRLRVAGDTAGLGTLSLSGVFINDANGGQLIPVDLLNSARIAVSKDGPDIGTVIGDTIGELVPCPAPGSPDTDSDTVYDTDEQGCGSDPLNTSRRPERLDLPGDDDGDTVAEEALPAGSEAFDCDGDGWPGNQENLIYLDAPGTARDQDPCGNNGWPSELSGNNNVLNIADIGSFNNPNRAGNDADAHGPRNTFSHALDDDGDTVIETTEDPGGPPGALYNVARWNLQTPPHTAETLINVGDVNGLINGGAGSPARPPMFGGQQAFFTNGGMCPWPG